MREGQGAASVRTSRACPTKLAQRLVARDFDRQAAELQVPIAVLNGCTALDMPVTEAMWPGLIREGGTRTISRFVQHCLVRPSPAGPSSDAR